MSSAINFFLLLILFLTPLIPQIGELGWEQIKVLFFILASSLAGSLYFWNKSNWTNSTKWTGVKLGGLGLLGILGVTSVLGVEPLTSFLGKPPYFQGFIVYAYLFLFSLIVASVPIKIEKWALVLSSSSLIISVLALEDFILMHVFRIPFTTYAGRVVSTFGQPNFYAGFLLLTLPFSYLLFKSPILQGHSLSTQGVTLNKKLRYLSYFGLFSGLICLLGIFISYSRSAVLMALLLVILGLIDQLKIKVKIGVVVFAVVLASAVIALRVGSGVVGNEVTLPILTKDPDLTRQSVEKRAYIWPVAFKIIQQKPLLGFGLENIGKSFSDYFMANFHSLFEENLQISPVLISLKELTIDRSHNYLLDLLLFSGILGLLGWLGLLGMLFKKLRQMSSDTHTNILWVSLITYLVWVQFQNQSVVHLIYFWLLVGLIDRR